MSQAPVTSEDLYLYSMHLLDPNESSRLEDFLHSSPEARFELGNIRGDLAYLALSVEQTPVPEASRQKFMASLARERRSAAVEPLAQASLTGKPAGVKNHTSQDPLFTQTAPADPQEPRVGQIYQDEPKAGFFERLLPWAGWAVAAGLTLSTWTFYQRSSAMQGQLADARDSATRSAAVSEKAVARSARAQTVLETLASRSAQRFLLTRQNTAPVPSARVTYLASTGALVFQGNNLESVPAEKTYELWLIPADKTAKPIPAGTFKPDATGYASLILPTLPKGVTAATFGITMEDASGSQSPTLPILLIGA